MIARFAVRSTVGAAALTTLVLALGGCPGGSGGGSDAASDALIDGPPAEGVRVWRREHAVVTRAQLTTMATALGLTGVVDEDDEQLRMIATAAGPTGPVTLRLVGGGSLSFASYVDASTSPGQLRGTIGADGTLVITQLALPPAITTLAAGGSISVQVALAGNGTGRVDLAAGILALSLPLTATATCSGAGCWAGTCTLGLGTLALSSSGGFLPSPYEFATGTATIEGDLVAPSPQVTSCTVAAPATVAAQLRFPSNSTGWRFDTELTPVFAPRQTTLSVAKDHGEVVYATPVVADPPAATMLPTDAAATTAALDLLTRAGLALPDPMLIVGRRTNDGGAPIAVSVRVQPRLAVDGAGALVPVEDAGAVITFGDGGVVQSVQWTWAPVTAGPLVSARSAAQAWTALGGTGPVPGPDGLALRYVAFEHGMEQPFLDPVWTVLGPDAAPLKIEPATDFTPRLGLETEIAGRTFDLAGALPLKARVERGTPPYTVTWTSSINGALGTGLTVDARLSAGSHVITLAVRDASGAGLSAQVPVEITRSPFLAPAAGPPAAVDVRGAMNVFPARVGASYLVSQRAERAGPRIMIRNARGEPAGTISPGAFRFKVTVRVAGQDHIIQSSKCIDYRQQGRFACGFPHDKVFAVVTDPEPLTWDGTTARARVSFDRLPGKLTFTYRYRAANVYAGPPPGTIQRGGAWFIHGSLIPQLGGVAPGVVPEIDWAYELPPPDDRSACVILYAMWRESRFIPAGDPEDVGSTTLTQATFAPCSSPPFTLPYEVRSIEVDQLTMVAPQAASGHYTALVNDGADETAALERTDGALDRTHQPSTIAPIGDGFSEITPIMLERAANLARPGGVGDWDNIHVKVAPSPYFVTFPGCNNVFAKERLIDYRACLHVHERWFNNPTASTGQDVNWYLLRDTGSERDPAIHPRRLVDGNVINGTPVILWSSSKATSAQCENNGGVENLTRPCRVARGTIFESH